MKIQKIIEDLVNAEVSRKNYSGTLKGKAVGERHPSSKKQLSNGSQASVKLDPNDPHMIKKHNINVFPEIGKVPSYRKPRENDGFNEYVEYLINHKLTDNIHFPKIYNIKTIIDKNGRKIHTYTMEKLVESDELSIKEVDAFLENNVTELWQERISHSNNPINFFARTLSSFVSGERGDINEMLTNDELIDAVNTLTKIKSAIGAEDDLSSNNIMWRRTPYGMILVFTDPFF